MSGVQVAADLRAAAEVLRRDGWTQGLFTDRDTGCHCVAGAVSVVVTDVGLTARWRDAIVALGAQVGIYDPWPTDVYRWNDDDGRTADEVIAALLAAADAAERKAAYDEGRWCGECQYGVVMDPPCCTTGQVVP